MTNPERKQIGEQRPAQGVKLSFILKPLFCLPNISWKYWKYWKYPLKAGADPANPAPKR